MAASAIRNAVLIVDDEAMLRLYAIDIVEEAGFVAVEAADADEAIRILGQRDDIAIVFTDVNMPGSMDGVRLAAAIRDRWPPIHIIVTSGLLRRDTVDLPSDVSFFSKPYDSRKLSAEVRRMAGGR